MTVQRSGRLNPVKNSLHFCTPGCTRSSERHSLLAPHPNFKHAILDLASTDMLRCMCSISFARPSFPPYCYGKAQRTGQWITTGKKANVAKMFCIYLPSWRSLYCMPAKLIIWNCRHHLQPESIHHWICNCVFYYITSCFTDSTSFVPVGIPA
jgi:hypothetical protein